MPEVRWHRSLYWRVGLGVVALLLALVTVQSAVFVWVSSRFAGRITPEEGGRLAETVATELRDAFAADPDLDARAFVVSRYGRLARPIVVALADGTAFGNHPVSPGPLMRSARAQLFRTLNPTAPEARRPDGEPVTSPPGTALVAVDDIVIGIVGVEPGRAPVMGVLRALGPTLAVTAAVLLAAGTGVAALLIVGPVRRRLRALGDAAAAIASGTATARAPEGDGDEVALAATQFNRMATALEARAADAAEADRVRRQLLADISHELMTPLTAIGGYVETLQMPEKRIDDATRARYLRVIEDQTRQMTRIVGDLLDLARLDDGGLPVDVRPTELGPLIERVTGRFEHECRTRGIAMPRSVEEGMVARVDAPRLEQVLQNLVANALRHTPDGGCISIAAARTPAGVRLTVRDTGPGIPPEHLPRIFDRFYKADPSRASGGSGLGLAIVRSIVSAHGGSIRASNDGGAVFELDLPR
ncbi:MAG: sensor histidine kinase [Vicinamibacterales bacterium]